MNLRARLNRFANESEQALSAHIRDARQTDAADALSVFLSRDDHDGLLQRLAAMDALLDTPHIGLVYLNTPVQPITTGPYHGAAQPVQP